MPTTTSPRRRGLGADHDKRRARLIAALRPGTPCPCGDDPTDPCGPGCPCRKAGHGLPMWRDPARNHDGRPLEADHTLARARGGTKADRLLLSTCNRSRGAGRQAEDLPWPTARDWWTRPWF